MRARTVGDLEEFERGGHALLAHELARDHAGEGALAAGVGHFALPFADDGRGPRGEVASNAVARSVKRRHASALRSRMKLTPNKIRMV